MISGGRAYFQKAEARKNVSVALIEPIERPGDLSLGKEVDKPTTDLSGDTISRPNLPKWAVLEQRMRTDSEGLGVVTHPDGHQSIHLNGRFLHMSAGFRDESGVLRIQCFTNYPAMNEAITGVPQPKQTESDAYEVAAY